MASRFGEHIRERREGLRRALGGEWSLRQVAARVGVSPTFLSRIERGEDRPTDEMVGRIAEALREDRGLLLALSERIPGDVEEMLSRRPALVDAVRALGGLPDEELRERVKAIREGSW